MKFHLRPFYFAVVLSIASSASAQFRNSPIRPVNPQREDRSRSNLVKEDGAIYLTEILDEDIEITIAKDAPAYTNLSAQRWIGTMAANQKGVLLAVSEKAYRVRGRAKQGQIAGWISKSAVEGLPKDFDENVKLYFQRYQLVSDLISKKQVALGMTTLEVCESIGDPDQRSTTIDAEGRNDTLEYIEYDRIPQYNWVRDRFGEPFQTVTYIKIETGKVTIEFKNDMVSSIKETEGVEFDQGNFRIVVPPPIFLLRGNRGRW